MNKMTTLALLLGVGLLVAAVPASAQCIEVTPESWDYGDVKVGRSESQIITIHSCGSSAVTVYYIGIWEGDVEAFTVGPVPDVPFPLPGGETLEVEVTFTPPGLGVHEAPFCVLHDATGGETCVDLSGVGISRWSYIESVAEP